MNLPLLLRAALIATALVSARADALGLGEITLHSRIGEPVRAELPLIAQDDNPPPDAGCFTLAPLPGADFPVITSARLRLVKIANRQRLIITGSQPVEEPIIAIHVRVGCGLDLQREYLLLPPPPPSADSQFVAEQATTDPAPPQRPKRRRAERSPAPMAADSLTEPLTPPPTPNTSSTPSSAPLAPKRPKKPAAPKAPETDRIVLGAAPTGPAGDSGLAALEQMDQRMLKLETTLRFLNQEVEKLDTVIALRSESQVVQQQLNTLQNRQSPAVPAAAPPAVPESDTAPQQWLELLAGVLLGGAVSAGVAHLVGRRHSPSRPFNAPPPRIVRPGKRPPPAS